MDSRHRAHVLASGGLIGIALLPAAMVLAGGRVPPVPELLGVGAFALAGLLLAGWSWRTRFAPASEDTNAFARRFALLRGLFLVVVVAAGLYLVWLERPIAGALVILWGVLRIRGWNERAGAVQASTEPTQRADAARARTEGAEG